jgi:hypothetical protein
MIEIRKALAVLLPAVLALTGQNTTPSPEGDALFQKQDWAGAARMRLESVTPQASGSAILTRMTYTSMAPDKVHQVWSG